jgi:hypothetical protein
MVRFEKADHPQNPLPGPEAGADIETGDHAAAAAARPRPGAILVIGAINDVVRFLLEIALLVVFAWFGAWLGSSWWGSTLLAVLFVTAFALSWGALAAPRRLLATPAWFPSFLFLALGGLAALALVAMGQPALAIGLAALCLLNENLRAVLRHRLRSAAQR